MKLELKNYTVIKEIGSGGMSVVYEAKDNKLKRTVALKSLHQHLCRDPSASARFCREALAAAKMDHPNIVRVYDYFSEDKSHYIAMEFVPGVDIETVLREKGKLEPGTALEVMWQIACALAEAHSLDIMHRDLKPANILIHKQGRAMLSDFGLAYHSADDHLTNDNAVAGTPPFMSPEQLSGKELSCASDIYSWAVTLCTMLTGKLPYDHQKFPEIIPDIQNGTTRTDLPELQSLPACYYELLKRCLLFVPSQRISDGTVLKQRLLACRQQYPLDSCIENLLADTGGKQTPCEFPISRTNIYKSVTGSRRKIFLVASGVIGLISGLGVVFILNNSKSTSPPSAHSVAPVAITDSKSNALKASVDLRSSPEIINAAVNTIRDTTIAVPVRQKIRTKRVIPGSAVTATDSGRLFVFCEPWATVFVNGRELGNTPFSGPVSLPAGDYKIKLINKHCVPFEDKVTVTAGATLRKRYNLELLKP